MDKLRMQKKEPAGRKNGERRLFSSVNLRMEHIALVEEIALETGRTKTQVLGDGYIVESRRGGGGYIRITRVHVDRQPIVVRNYRQIRPDGKMIRRVLALGIPSGIENSMFQLGKLAIQSSVSTLGTVAIAAQAMTNILENLNGIAAIGVGIGLMTVVGQCLGAGRKDEAVYYIKKLSVLAEIIVVASCLLVFALTIPVTKLGGMEPESERMCFHMISWITVVKPIVWTLAFIPAYGLRAAGDVKFSMITSCCTMWAYLSLLYSTVSVKSPFCMVCSD